MESLEGWKLWLLNYAAAGIPSDACSLLRDLMEPGSKGHNVEKPGKIGQQVSGFYSEA